MTKRSSPAGSGRGRRGLVREGYKVVALLLKPSLGLFGLVCRSRILLPHLGSATSCYIVTYADSHLHTCTYICRIIHNDTTTKTDALINDARRKTQEDFFNNILPLTLFVRFACERVLETEHKLHILTPLLWPSRCVLFSCCWGQLHRGFPRAPSVGFGFHYHIWSLAVWKSAGNCIGGFRGPPRSGVAFPTTSRL